ncbi:MAG: GNAT family N-acetyltransferase [Helicobacteraceae bacterium]|nr:GNAT family N-acetyltransferase [Helicobacteraceae bacterium]
MQIRELSLKELLSAYEVVRELYEDLSYQEFEDLIYDMRHIEYKMIGLFEKEKIISYAGVAVSTDLIYKRHLRVYEFITAEPYESEKYDALLYEYLLDYAKMGMCGYLVFSQEGVCTEPLEQNALYVQRVS